LAKHLPLYILLIREFCGQLRKLLQVLLLTTQSEYKWHSYQAMIELNFENGLAKMPVTLLKINQNLGARTFPN
jgi:hypothetical protein